MKNVSWIIALIVGLAAGYVLGGSGKGGPGRAGRGRRVNDKPLSLATGGGGPYAAGRCLRSGV